MLPSHFYNKKGHLKDFKFISHSFQPRPALIQPDPECDRVIWFPSQLRRLIERRKSRWRFSSSLFIYVRSSPILCGQATEWRSIDGSIVEWPHSAALGRLECAVHGQAWMVFWGVWAVYFNRPLYWVGCLLGFFVFAVVSLWEFRSFKTQSGTMAALKCVNYECHFLTRSRKTTFLQPVKKSFDKQCWQLACVPGSASGKRDLFRLQHICHGHSAVHLVWFCITHAVKRWLTAKSAGLH